MNKNYFKRVQIAVVFAFDWAKAQGIVTLSTEEN